ncbi:hypothetical protein NDU88_000075 [Pleurodeles waltl]|uniref:Uncharacterized protein n=1 Tax=Pleurodeles waltl TaxID=8319 RepID=A0AAV7N969_PLEWA|nr:hypothetical protein NDU88_000075 [Pleurodeles waltl]
MCAQWIPSDDATGSLPVHSRTSQPPGLWRFGIDSLSDPRQSLVPTTPGRCSPTTVYCGRDKSRHCWRSPGSYPKRASLRDADHVDEMERMVQK